MLLQFNPTKWATLQSNMKRIGTLNQATKIKHVFGVTQFSDMSLTERAKFRGMKRRTKTLHLDNVTSLHAEVCGACSVLLTFFDLFRLQSV